MQNSPSPACLCGGHVRPRELPVRVATELRGEADTVRLLSAFPEVASTRSRLGALVAVEERVR